MTEPSPQSPRKITARELEQKLSAENNAVLIDVRTAEEYQEGHIPDAINVPLDTINEYQGSKDQALYVICRSGRRSRTASNALRENGYDPINIEDGICAWQGEVERT